MSGSLALIYLSLVIGSYLFIAGFQITDDLGIYLHPEAGWIANTISQWETRLW
jgi:hypothetical protein